MSAEALAVTGGTIIDGNGGPPIRDGVLLIEGKRIVAVGDRSMVVPAGVRQIVAAGKYVMPGMMDANVHLFFSVIPDVLIRFDGRYEELIAEAAQVALKGGLTTLFDTWGPRDALTHVRDDIDAGKLIGSRIFFAGNIIGFGGPTSSDFFAQSRAILTKRAADSIDGCWEQSVGPDLLWGTPQEIRARVRAYIQSGHQNFLKYASSAHFLFQFICFSAEAQRAIVEEGHRAGMTVQAHTTSPESLRMEIEAGCDLLQHPDITGPVPMPEETLAVIAKRGLPCAAMFVTRRFQAWCNQSGSEGLQRVHNRFKDENDRRLIASGAPILLTTDAGVFPRDVAENPVFGPFISPHDSPIDMGEAHFRWLVAAGELGMKPMDALLAATRNPARAYKVDRDLGTLEKGKIADLLVLDKDPLESPENYRSVGLIMKEGRVVDRDSLPVQRLLTA